MESKELLQQLSEAKAEIERLKDGIKYIKAELLACADMGVIAKSAHVLRYIESLVSELTPKESEAVDDLFRFLHESNIEFCGLTFNKDATVFRIQNKEKDGYDLLNIQQVLELFNQSKTKD